MPSSRLRAPFAGRATASSCNAQRRGLPPPGSRPWSTCRRDAHVPLRRSLRLADGFPRREFLRLWPDRGTRRPFLDCCVFPSDRRESCSVLPHQFRSDRRLRTGPREWTPLGHRGFCSYFEFLLQFRRVEALPPELRLVRPPLAAVENANVEAIVGHDPARGLGRIVGRADRRRMNQILPCLLIGPVRDARAQNLDKGKTGMADGLDENSCRFVWLAREATRYEIGSRCKRVDKGVERTEAGATGRNRGVEIGFRGRRRLTLGHAV